MGQMISYSAFVVKVQTSSLEDHNRDGKWINKGERTSADAT